MDAALDAIPAEEPALAQVVQSILLWSDRAFARRSLLTRLGETAVLRPDIAGLIRVSYDKVLPDQSRDASLALRVFARLISVQA